MHCICIYVCVYVHPEFFPLNNFCIPLKNATKMIHGSFVRVSQHGD